MENRKAIEKQRTENAERIKAEPNRKQGNDNRTTASPTKNYQ